jgi:hypothetical protein
VVNVNVVERNIPQKKKPEMFSHYADGSFTALLSPKTYEKSNFVHIYSVFESKLHHFEIKKQLKKQFFLLPSPLLHKY